MNKKEIINRIDETCEFLTNGLVKINNCIFTGHPCFYLLHSKQEFNNKLKEAIVDKEKYNKFDLYYYLSYMFKYMLHPYDCHTKAQFIDKKFLPLKIRIINDIPYIVDCNPLLNNFKGNEIKKINDVKISTVICELEEIICYSSESHLKTILEDYLTNVFILKSLPSLTITDSIIIKTDKNEIKFDLNNLDVYKDTSRKENYNFDVIENIGIITYNSCKDKTKMENLIHKLKTMTNINKYVVDLRGNGGGDSSINKELVKFLNGKKVITLCDERVFSSARMCLIDLKNIGAKVIGTSPGTSINCFGNIVMQKEITDMNLKIFGSATYWYYDENLKCHGIYKEDFKNALQKYSNLLKPVFFQVDKEIKLTLDDYLNHNDSVMNFAINNLKKTN